MNQAVASNSLNNPRLVRLLAELGISGARLPRDRFAERLGQLTDLADSIRIAAVHRRAAADFQPANAPANNPAETLREEFLSTRGKLVESVVRKLSAEGRPSRLDPPETPPAPELSKEACDPYLKFLGARQADIEFRVRNLHLRVRDVVGSLSADAARLVALDTALGDTLAGHGRKHLAGLSILVEPRFRYLLETGQNKQLFADMQALLLADIETRLLPVVGLVEAMDNLSKPHKHADL